MNVRLDNRVAVVTGAGRGIGHGEALALAAAGASVVVNDLGGSWSGEGADRRPAEQVAEEIRAAGGAAVASFDDVTTAEGAQRVIDQAVAEFGRLDVLVNNAGILRDGMLFSIDPDEWFSVVAMHLRSHFLCTRAAGAYWRGLSKAREDSTTGHRAVINTTSESGLFGQAGQSNYDAAKLGILSFTIAASRELGKYGVTVNAIAPRARTRLTMSTFEGSDREQEFATDGLAFDPMDPDNIAPFVAFLASDAAADVTAQAFIVYGSSIARVRMPQVGETITGEGRWTAEEIAARRDELFVSSTAGHLEGPRGYAKLPRQPTSWGRDVEVDRSGPYPMRAYRLRRRRTAELLLDARRFGEREHIVQGGTRLTFDEHERAITRVAGSLRERGVEPGDPVMLLGTNSVQWVLAYWALLRIGAVAVLGNAWWSATEVAEACGRVEPRLVLVDARLAAHLPDGLETRLTDTLLAFLGASGAAVPELDPISGSEHDPAIVLFSAGTTGSPKGVVLPHRAIIANVHNVLNMSRRLPHELDRNKPASVSLHTMPLFHIGGLQTLMSNLMAGGKMVFLTGRFDAGEALQLIESERISHWAGVPTMLSRMLEHPEFESRDTSSMRAIVIAGSSVPPDLRQRVAARFTGTKRRGGGVNYGLTESGGTVCIASPTDADEHPGTVGRAVPIAEIAVAPAEDGMPGGEVLIRGSQVMLGYWPVDATDPGAGPIDADGWLHTGDLGRLDEDGWLSIVGRSKDIIIRGGENIASAQVEARLRLHPAVLDVAVVGLPHPDLGEEVGAAVVLQPGAAVEPEELRAFAAEALARFAVPSRWWLRAEPLPVNGVGKVLKRMIADEFPVAETADA